MACARSPATYFSRMNGKTILISGAGIAGPTLAFWLRAAGLQPTLVERAPQPRTGGYVVDFWGLGYDIAERMGLIGDINRIGTTCARCELSTRPASGWLASEPAFSES
jgi:2-polyprenyl-6-methoxyphenol hydroxylase-like FAD-dependent oxidoreductase